ncbi:glycosyltransferase family 4 protein [Cellulomonas cellasea]|uniref:glycosyltransferase family 4 protein n=1 Tax=Cellulomonas cellasea TaxID=43670 RepID=UPI0025A3F30D|nr:glycosyltransferase family 4 protein [Cellulomonas cellasea]MDM8085628.1 glycosyltransferase family 4 protein [Cellulomonas cellasea]
MRIAHISDCYPPRTGGIESQVGDLAARQAAAGHDVHVLTATPDSDPAGGAGSAPGVTVHRIGMALPFELPVNPRAPAVLRSLLRDMRPDVVHVHAGVVSPFAFDGARAAVGQGLPTAITWHCMLDGAVLALRAAVRVSRWRQAPVALSAVSHVAARRVAQVFGAPVRMMPNGVDLDAWRPDPAAVAAQPAGEHPAGEHPAGEPRGGTPLRLVAATRLAPRKRASALVDVVAAAADELPAGSVRLTIFGDGPARRRIAARAARRAPHLVELRGRVSRAELRAAYDEADVFLAPAALESFGLAALEARAAGLAVVARRGTGIEEFVADGSEGLIAGSDAAMARAVVRLAEEPRLLAEIRAHNRALPPTFGWPHVLEVAAAEYRRAVGLATVDHRVRL